MSEKIQRAVQVVQRHLDAIEKTVFNTGYGMKLTFIARDATNDEADFVVTSDNLREVAHLVERSIKREQIEFGGAA